MKPLTKFAVIVVLLAFWIVAGVGGAAWLADQPSAFAVTGAVLCIGIVSFICVKGVSACVRW